MSFEDKLAELGDAQFVDEEFPADPASLMPEMDEEHAKWSEIQWVRASEIACLKDEGGNQAIFLEDISPNDIKQGGLGDCYFLSVLSVLAEHPDRIRKLFATDQVNPQGMYGINMVKNGKAQTVIIDDFIPCSAGDDPQPSFSKGNGAEIWVLLLEKAWAKIHGSYERIELGDAALTFRDLTGAPSFTVKSADEDAFEKILEAVENQWALSAGTSSEPGDKEKLNELGLVAEHCYGVLAAMQVEDKNGNPVNLVKLRNPWGNFEWKGAWGDNSDEWTDELKEQCQVNPDADDGTFWMAFDDFKNYFSYISIGKIVTTHVFSDVEVPMEETKHAVIDFTVPESGQYTLSVAQMGKRMFPRGSDYEYLNAKIIIWKNNQEGFVDEIQKMQARDSHIEFDYLAKGRYKIYIELPESRKVHVTSYGRA